MPRLEKQSKDMRVKSQRALIQSQRKDDAYHIQENKRNNERISLLRKDDEYRLRENSERKYRHSQQVENLTRRSQKNEQCCKIGHKDAYTEIPQTSQLLQSVFVDERGNDKCEISMLTQSHTDCVNEFKKIERCEEDVGQDSRKRAAHSDNNDSPFKKTKIDDCNNLKISYTDKERKQQMRANDVLRCNERFQSVISKQAKNGDKKATLYKRLLLKESQVPDVCTCCMRVLYDGISQLTLYKRKIIEEHDIQNLAYNFKETEFLCNQCWSCLRKNIIPKRAATQNLSFPNIPDCLKKLSPLGARLVSPWLPFLQVIPLQQYTANPQLSLKGNIVNIQVDVGQMMKSLPRLPEDTQVVQVILKRKKDYKSSYMAENIIVEEVRQSWEFLKASTLYQRFGITANVDFFSQFTQDREPFIVDKNDKVYITGVDHDIKQRLSGEQIDVIDNDKNNDKNDDEQDLHGNFDSDEILLIDQNHEVAESTRIIAPGENKCPTPMYNIPYYEIFCNPIAFGGEPFDEDKILTTNEKHKYWLLHKDPRCRLNPTFVLLLGQMTVQKRTYDSLNFVTRKGFKNDSLNAGKVLDGKLTDEMIRLDEGYKFLKPVVASAPYFEDKKKLLIAMMAQIGMPSFFLTLSATIEMWPHLLQQLYTEQHGQSLSISDVMQLDQNTKAGLIRNNPVLVARYITRRFTSIVECLKNPDGPFGHFYVEDYVQKEEVQQKGNLHRHLILWPRNAPKYDPEDSTSEKNCITFIDNFITCELDTNNPYVSGNQMHKHTFTCYKGQKNLKSCRFHFPLWPMPRTMILKKLASEEKTSYVKSNYAKIKNYLNELAKTPRDIPFVETLNEIGITELEYITAARCEIRTTRVFLSRRSNEMFMNPYNRDILMLLKSNMDIQFICDPYACVAYLTDYIVKVEQKMSKLFRMLIQQFAHEDFTNSEKVKKYANAFVNSRVLAAQEAACLVLHLPLFKTSRIGMNVPTFPIDERTRVVKRNKELGKLAFDSTDIYCENIIEKYCKRNKNYESMCLADFATGFTDPQKLVSKRNKKDDDCDSENDHSTSGDDDDDGVAKVKAHTKRKILRTRRYKRIQDEDNYFREMLLLYLPFTNEKSEIEDVDHKKVFMENEKTIAKNRALIYSIDEDYLEDIFQNAEEQDGSDLEEDSEFKLAKKSSSDELIDIFGQNNDNEKSDSKTKDYKISVPKVMEEKDILELLLKANEQQLQITMHCLHALKQSKPIRLVVCGQAGTGKSFLIKLLYQTITDYFNKKIPCQNIESAKVILSAPSGKAAFVIGGVTIHSCLSLPCDNNKGRSLPSLSSSTVNSLRLEMRDVKVVIMDEVSMIGRNRLNQIDTRLRQITGNNHAFGGLSVIFFGDFRQLPPVMDKPIYFTAQHYLRDRKADWERKNPDKPFQPNLADSTYSDLFATDNWVDFDYYELTKVMRQDNMDFVNALNNLSMGTMTDHDIRLIRSRCNVKNIPDDAIHLFYTNKDVASYNEKRISEMPGELFEHRAVDYIQGWLTDRNTITKTLEALSKLPFNQTGCLLQTIHAKIDVKLMITRNISVAEGLVNGASGVLKHVTRKPNADEIITFWLEFDSNDIGRTTRSKYLPYLRNNGLNVNLVPIFPEVVTDIPVGKKVAGQKQFPLVPAEAVTVHKSQGQTYKSVCVHNHKMTRTLQYVAYSRVTSIDGLFIEGDFKPPPPLEDSSDLKIELNRLKNEKFLLTFEQPLSELQGTKIVFHNTLSLHKYLGCVKIDEWFHGADILIFVETRTLPSDHVFIDGYDVIYRSDEQNIGKKFRRGLIVYKKMFVNVKLLNNITENDQSTNSVGHVDLVALVANDLSIIGGYRSPHASRDFFRECMDTMIISCEKYENLVVIGDFNCDCYGNDISWLESYMCTHKNLKRALPHAVSTTNLNTEIDMIFFNQSEFVSGTYESITSDHKPIFFCDKGNTVADRALADHIHTAKYSVPAPFLSSSVLKSKNCKIPEDHNISDKKVSNSKKKKNEKILKFDQNENSVEMQHISAADKILDIGNNDLNTISLILQKISDSETLDEVKNILRRYVTIFSEVCDQIRIASREAVTRLTDHQFQRLYLLKRSCKSAVSKETNRFLNETFEFHNVIGDGNCLYRAFADSIYSNEHKYPYIKMFVINEIVQNIDYYGPLVFMGAIGVNEQEPEPEFDEAIIIQPQPHQIVDYLKLVAREGTWGNEGTFYAMSNALNINIFVLSEDRETETVNFITKYISGLQNVYGSFTILNQTHIHFMSALRRSLQSDFEQHVNNSSNTHWRNVRIHEVNVVDVFAYGRDLYDNRRNHRNYAYE